MDPILFDSPPLERWDVFPPFEPGLVTVWQMNIAHIWAQAFRNGQLPLPVSLDACCWNPATVLWGSQSSPWEEKPTWRGAGAQNPWPGLCAQCQCAGPVSEPSWSPKSSHLGWQHVEQRWAAPSGPAQIAGAWALWVLIALLSHSVVGLLVSGN